MSITGLNLALSNRCTAQCVFCPSERGTRDPGFMDLDFVGGLMAEVSAEDFPWRVKSVQIGENGDAMLNPWLYEILHLIRGALPKAKINLTTNMYLLDEPRARWLLRERLIDSLQLNVDGHDKASYEAQKGLPYDWVMNNLRAFVGMRKVHWPDFPLGINILTLTDYCAAIQKRWGQPPLKAPEVVPPSSFEQVLESLSWLPPGVGLRKSLVFSWAERKMDVNLPDKLSCPQLPRIEEEAFISPSGWWYPCCLDSNQDQAYGNVKYNGLMEVYNSPARALFLERLRTQNFEGIGYPCDRAPFCGGMK